MNHNLIYVQTDALTVEHEEQSARRGAKQEVNTALQHQKPNLNKSAHQQHCT